MKKEEAMQIAPERSRLLCEYITQILSDEQIVQGKIRIHAIKVNNENVLAFDIIVPNRDFEKYNMNTEISIQQVNVLTGQILNDLLDYYLESETIGCTRYYSIRGGYGMNMDGVNITNIRGSNIKIDFVCRGDQFDDQVRHYNARIDEYVKQQTHSEKLRK